MAEVWKAKAYGVQGFEKILVIKRILPDLSENPSFVEMFINEAKIAVSLSHANIVQVFDLGETDGSYFIAMEYVAGMDLSTLLKKVQPLGGLSPMLAAYTIGELLKGLDYAHRRRDAQGNSLNIIHRDVSPQNLLISLEGEVKLTDFGIAKARTFAQQATELGVVKGKYAYMAPEQLLGRPMDARSDVFAAGILLYESLCGQNPFQSDTTYDTLQRLRDGQVTPLENLVPNLPPELGQAVRRAMALKPEHRYATAAYFYEDLVQYLYAGRHRVGPRDLAEVLRRIQQPSYRADSGTHLKAAFESDSQTVHDKQPLGLQTEPSARPPAQTVAKARTKVGRKATREARKAVTVATSTRERTERRDVTALCCVCDRDDPLAEATIRALIERHGGSLSDPALKEDPVQRTVCALFGDRVPDGRDSETAAHCALKLTRAATAAAAGTDEGATDSTLAIGICAGRVLVDLSGKLLNEGSCTATLATAARQAIKAGASQILVDASTERELRSRFRLDAVGPNEKQGYLLLSKRSTDDVYGRFIGRRDVLKAIGEALSKANRGQLQLLGVTGEAGAGKSRLLPETMRRLKLAGYGAAMHTATLTPQLRKVPLSALQEMLRVVLAIDEFDSESKIRGRMRRLRELGLLPAEQNAVGAVLGVSNKPLDNGQRPLRAAILRVVRKLAEDKLTIFAWDGAENIDAASLGIFGELIEAATHAPIALFFNYRDGSSLAEFRALDNFREICLSPMSDGEVARLIATRLGADEIPFELLREVVSKSAGNPLYVEEHIKALQEAQAVVFDQGQVIYQPAVAKVEVPKTLRGIIASRIAKVPTATRYLLQVAALAGERFNVPVVAVAAQEELQTVVDALDDCSLRGILGGSEALDRWFMHSLVRQVIEQGITLSAQREIHLALADAIVSLRPNQEDELASRLAHHYESANDHKRAVEYLGRSATRLEREGAFEGAMADLKRALRIMTSVSSFEAEEVFQHYQRIAELAYRGRALLQGAELLLEGYNRADALRALRWAACFSMWRGRLLAAASRVDEGGQWLDQAQHVARGLTDVDLSREVFIASADVDARRGLFDRAVGYLQEALQLARRDGNGLGSLRCLIPLALTYARMGDHQSALHTLKAIEQLADQLQVRPDVRCEVYRLGSQIAYHARDQRRAASILQQAVQTARSANLPYHEALNLYNLGDSYLRLGEHRQAFAALRRSYEISTERGYERLQMSTLRELGFIDATRFGSVDGRTRVAHTLNYAEENNFVWDLIHGKYLMAIVEQSRGAISEARTLLQQVLTLAQQHNHRKYAEDAEDALRLLADSQPLILPE